MKLRNKKTGEIADLIISIGGEYYVLALNMCKYDSPIELAKEWEEYEEPKTFFSIYYDGTISEFKDGDDEQIRDMKAIGNYFGTKEEAERAVEKLRALKRLKDKGFRFVEWQQHGITEDGVMDGAVYFEDVKNVDKADLDLLFGGKE